MQAQLRSGSSGSSGEGLQALCHGLVLPKVRLTRARRRSHVQPSQALRDSDCGLARGLWWWPQVFQIDCKKSAICPNRESHLGKFSCYVALHRGEKCVALHREEKCVAFAQRGEVCGFCTERRSDGDDETRCRLKVNAGRGMNVRICTKANCSNAACGTSSSSSSSSRQPPPHQLHLLLAMLTQHPFCSVFKALSSCRIILCSLKVDLSSLQNASF